MNRKTLTGLAGAAVAGGAGIAFALPVIRKRALRATTILEKDHRIVSGLFFEMKQTPNASIRKSIFNQIRHQLDVHSQVMSKEELDRLGSRIHDRKLQFRESIAA